METLSAERMSLVKILSAGHTTHIQPHTRLAYITSLWGPLRFAPIIMIAHVYFLYDKLKQIIFYCVQLFFKGTQNTADFEAKQPEAN